MPRALLASLRLALFSLSLCLLWPSTAWAAPKVQELVVCRQVERRVPVGRTSFFHADEPQALVWMRIENAGGHTRLRVEWLHAQRRVKSVWLKIPPSPGYRTWVHRPLGAADEGEWAVHVYTEAGTLLEQAQFTVLPAGAAAPAPDPAALAAQQAKAQRAHEAEQQRARLKNDQRDAERLHSAREALDPSLQGAHDALGPAQAAPEPAEVPSKSAQDAPEPAEAAPESAQDTPEPTPVTLETAQVFPQSAEVPPESAQAAPKEIEAIEDPLLKMAATEAARAGLPFHAAAAAPAEAEPAGLSADLALPSDAALAEQEREAQAELLRLAAAAAARAGTPLELEPEAGAQGAPAPSADAQKLGVVGASELLNALHNEPESDASDPADEPVTDEPTAHTEAAARPAPPAALPPSQCRVLLNLEDDAGHYATLDLHADHPQLAHSSAPGLVSLDPMGQAYALRVVHGEDHLAGPHGRVERSWAELRALALTGRARPQRWAGTALRVRPARGPDQPPAYEHSELRVLSIIGPLVGLDLQHHGRDAEGQPFNHDHYLSVRPPGRPADLSTLLGPRLILRASVRAHQLRPDALPDAPQPNSHDWHRAALLAEPADLRVRARLPCCTFAENAGRLELDVTLGAFPEHWGDFLPDPQGRYHAPNGCAELWLAQDQLWVQPKGGRAQAVPFASGALKRLLGLYFIAAQHPYAASAQRTAFEVLGTPTPSDAAR